MGKGPAAGTAGHPIAAHALTKRFGSVAAVTGLSFEVLPGRVTGFLGPNGAGKTTTMRMLLGLIRPTSGTATVGGRPYPSLDHPSRVVGAGLDGSSFHPGRTGRNHLRWLCAGAGVPRRRADEVLELVGLEQAAGRGVRGYSTGMRQRLALAGALLGDPRVLVLDEPANGLDPAGIAWLRGFLRTLAGEGRTVFVSSHVLSEVQQTVDDVVVISSGRLAYAGPLAGMNPPTGTLVGAPDRERLRDVLADAGWTATPQADALHVADATPQAVGAAAHAGGVALSLLTPAEDTVEQAYLRLVAEAEQRSGGLAPAPTEPATAGTRPGGSA